MDREHRRCQVLRCCEFNDLKTRGCNDILIAVTDGLKGMPEALAAVYPATTLQTCIVHLIRNSLDYASWKDRKELAAAIKPICTAPSAEAAQAELDAFAQGPWGSKFPAVAAAWRRAWDRVIPFYAFPPEMRRVIYTTNASGSARHLDDERRANSACCESSGLLLPAMRRQLVDVKLEVEARLADARRRETEDLTFREMFEAWLADGVTREDGNAELRRALERDVIPAIGDKPVRLVDDTDLRITLRRVGRDRGAGRTAQRMLSELRQLYRWALSRKPWRTLVADGSPAELVEARQVVNDDHEGGIRDRVLSDAEIRELHAIQVRQRCTYESRPAGHRYSGVRPMKRENELAIWIMLATLCRAGETMKAEWKDVDLHKAEWFLPAANTKTKVPILVYLSPFALRQFTELHLLTGRTPWCFPARPKGRVREGAQSSDRHVHEKSASKQVGDRQVRFMSREGSRDHRPQA